MSMKNKKKRSRKIIENENTILLTICCYTIREDICKKVTPEQSF